MNRGSPVTEANAVIDGMFADVSPLVRATYDAIVAALAAIGPFSEEVRQESIHLAHSVTFASVHPLTDHLILVLRTDQQIDHERVERSEQVSDNRWEVRLSLSDPDDIDSQMRSWLNAAMELT